MLNGDSTGGVNSTGNVDYSKMDRQLNNYLDKSVKTDDSKNKENENPNKMGTLDDMAKFDSLKNDGDGDENEEDSWPNTSEVKITNAEDETSPNYEEDFDDGEELELITKEQETGSMTDNSVPEKVKDITELEPNSENTLRNSDNFDENRGFDLSPIHSSQIKTPGESQNLKESSMDIKNFESEKLDNEKLESENYEIPDKNPPSPKRVSISLPNEQQFPRPTTATQQRKEFTKKSISEKETSSKLQKIQSSILRKKNANRYKH